MHVITALNVRDALPKAVRYLQRFGHPEKTRGGEVLAATKPVTIHYNFPKQHVLLNEIRDANPFFHIMEAMWMLAGRNDGIFLDHYVKDFSKLYGVKGIIPDAYGYRWRYGLRYDQLLLIIEQLKKDPGSRQCVLQMWGAGRHDLDADVQKPCNLVITFRILADRLDMTVFNRSNDVIWGCCGANAVHFPILQEYMATMIGVKMGSYWQVSNNLHLYKEHKFMLEGRIKGERDHHLLDYYLKDSGTAYEKTQPLITYPNTFEEELLETMQCIDDLHQDLEIYGGDISNGFLREVVLPMAMAHQRYKNKDRQGAFRAMSAVIAEDWQKAGTQWLERRNGTR
jgi:thymidylate synthase